MIRPRYRRRELLPHPGSMRPLYYRRRTPQRLFTCPNERRHVASLLEDGAWPLSLRNGIPLFWYAVMGKDGLRWLSRSGLSAQDLDRPATMPDGGKRTLFEQVTLRPKSLRHFLGRGIGKHFTHLGKLAVPPGSPSKPNKRHGQGVPTYEEIAGAVLLLQNRLPTRSVVEDLLQRDWPEVRALIEALLLNGETNKNQTAAKIQRL